MTRLFEHFTRIVEERSDKSVVVLYPGRFQPMHRGHLEVYEDLKRDYDGNVYIYTSDDTSSFKSPFTFDEKRLIMTRLLDIPGDRIWRTKSPYMVPKERISDPETTVVLFAVSEKDMEEDARFEFPADGSPAMRQDGLAKYIQKYPGSIEECKPSTEHSYVVVVPVNEFNVAGQTMTSSTDVRTVLIGEEDTARQAFEDLYGKFDQEMFDMMREKIEARALTLESILSGWVTEL